MNAVVKPYDPLDAALQQLIEFNAQEPNEREYTEAELIRLLVHQVKQHG